MSTGIRFGLGVTERTTRRRGTDVRPAPGLPAARFPDALPRSERGGGVGSCAAAPAPRTRELWERTYEKEEEVPVEASEVGNDALPRLALG